MNEIRKEENIRFAEKLGIPFIDAGYDVQNWFKRAKGLEWETSSPPPTLNFVSPPEVPRIPYDYPIQATESKDQHR